MGHFFRKSIYVILFLVGLYGFYIPDDTNNMTKEKLGELLFHETRLSSDNSISCASCHIPEFAFSDTLPFSQGVGGKFGKRNTPSAMNMASRQHFFYDGRAHSLEHQVHFPINDPLEMNFSIQGAVELLRMDDSYNKYFYQVYGKYIDSNLVVDAIAAFERTLETSNTPFDAWMNGDKLAMSESAIRGRKIFMSEKAKCFDCHFSPDFTGDEFRNIGLYNGKELNDAGRFLITNDSSDLGKFKVPSLRNISMTGPYMHNGMFKTLREVINYYDNPYAIVSNPVNIDSLMLKPIGLTEQEKLDLESFLHALTDVKFIPKK